jgi:hypothetical protein
VEPGHVDAENLGHPPILECRQQMLVQKRLIGVDRPRLPFRGRVHLHEIVSDLTKRSDGAGRFALLYEVCALFDVTEHLFGLTSGFVGRQATVLTD